MVRAGKGAWVSGMAGPNKKMTAMSSSYLPRAGRRARQRILSRRASVARNRSHRRAFGAPLDVPRGRGRIEYPPDAGHRRAGPRVGQEDRTGRPYAPLTFRAVDPLGPRPIF